MIVLSSIEMPYTFKVYYARAESLTVFCKLTISSFLSIFDEQVLGIGVGSGLLVSTHLLVDTFRPVKVT